MASGYSSVEKARLQKACPKNVLLHYNYQTGEYEFLYKPPGVKESKVVGSVPRTRVLRWQQPNTILNHAVRHALKVHKLPTKIRLKGTPKGTLVDVHAE